MTLREKFKHYFIWEKSNFYNEGISFKFNVSKYCYIKPTSCSIWDNLFRKEYFDGPMFSLHACRDVTYFWLWFRITIRMKYRNLSDTMKFLNDYYL